MSTTTAGAEKRAEIIKAYATKEGDTGSPEVQVALLSDRISGLTEHLKVHSKDFHSTRGLMKMVGTRRSLLNYLRKTDYDKYLKIIQELELRK